MNVLLYAKYFAIRSETDIGETNMAYSSELIEEIDYHRLKCCLGYDRPL